MHFLTVAEHSSSRADRPERREDDNHSTPGAHGPQGTSDHQGHHYRQDSDRYDHVAQVRTLDATALGIIAIAREKGRMTRNSTQNSRSAAKAVSKILRDQNYSVATKKAAGSALAQTPKRYGK